MHADPPICVPLLIGEPGHSTRARRNILRVGRKKKGQAGQEWPGQWSQVSMPGGAS